MAIRNKACDATVYDVDLGKSLFHVVGTDATGRPIHKARFRRDTVLQFFERAAPAVVGMEACPGAQWLARKVKAMGHTVRIVPAQFVKLYVKSNKNDIIDASAITEAVTRPTMRFVEVKSPDQVDLQALHRVRERMVTARTRLICQMRAFCLEHGVAMRQDADAFKLDLSTAMEDESNDLTPMMRRLLGELRDDLLQLETSIAAVSREIEAVAARSDVARRLASIPGIGPLRATAIVAAIGRPAVRQSARPRGLDRPRAAAALNRWPNHAARHQQAREPVYPQAADPWRPVLPHALEPQS